MGQTQVIWQAFGAHDGQPVLRWSLTRETDLGPVTLDVISYGAAIQRLVLPDAFGTPTDIALGYDTLEEYVAGRNYFGAIVGRYGNRIRNSTFALEGSPVHLDANEGVHHLHGGTHGFHDKVWDGTVTEDGRLVLHLTSPDGDMGYPGKLEVQVTYQLTGQGAVLVDIEATADEATVCNIVQHSLWNLGGHASGTVRDHVAHIPAAFYTPVDDTLLPTGEVTAVADTAFDFRTPKPIGRDLEALSDADYDHNFVLGLPDADGLRDAAEVVCPGNGLGLRLRTTEPGVQVYVGSYLTPAHVGKDATPYQRNAGIALETQTFPDSPNLAHFPSATLAAGERYVHRMTLQFFHDERAERVSSVRPEGA